ncbi:Arm DNA-binding domain-containing protein [Candidatus Tisiphia endosymbiont of Parasteatoda lunata]|uniref:Arm DNA-binding domain-containing protein n=1 Tax=Candidatus Tisiphia endosymbiont of Parasteatoda lunata TaxID=3066275 RepID=UPI00313C9D44
MTTELNFTQEAISKIISHKTKQEVYVDTKEPGLILIASPGKNNTKVFYLRKTVDGTYRTIKLGKFPYMSVAEARNKAIELKAQIASGINPIKKLAITSIWDKDIVNM